MADYSVIEPLLYDNQPYPPGSAVSMDPEAAAPLVAKGVLSEAAPGPGGKESLNVAATVERVNACVTLDELDQLGRGETRKGVLAAIARRWDELSA